MLARRCLSGCMSFLLAICIVVPAMAQEVSVLADRFADPPNDYSSGPLWVWHESLTEAHIRGTLQDLASQRVRQAFVHPRPGLMTPYMSEAWMELWRAALEEAERLDMLLWIYDENSYPSGFAGGLVPEAMPESRGLGLRIREERQAVEVDDLTLAVYRLSGDTYENITSALRDGVVFDEGTYRVISIEEATASPWFGGKFYVDLLRPGVTEKFLELTMEPYRKAFGEHFGKRIPGVFTDEPHLRPAGTLHWTPDLPQVFKARWGYELLDHLPALFETAGDWKRVRHNYFQTLHELFVERWAQPYEAYCEANGLELTGHYWEHGWPSCIIVPDNMAMYAFQQRPAIDILFNQYNEGPNAQFGNVRAVLELASVANQLGKKRTLCETYGGAGWDLRFEDMKRIGDWIYVLGVNTLNEHLSHITLRGARKRDYPQSFSYHATWWEQYHLIADYFTRLSVALSAGQQVNTVLFIQPTTTAWMYQLEAKEHLDALGVRFQEQVTAFAQAQVEFDLGAEDLLARFGAVERGKMRVGERLYEIVVLPQMMENVNVSTLALLSGFLDTGGTVLSLASAPPSLLDGMPSEALAELAHYPNWINVRDTEHAIETLLELQAEREAVMVHRNPGDPGILYHHRRRLDEGELLFLVNTSIDAAARGKVHARYRGVTRWDPQTGQTALSQPHTTSAEGLGFEFDLPPAGSLLLHFSEAAAQPEQAPMHERLAKLPLSDLMVQRLDANVLTLDYVDVTVGGETRTGLFAPFAGDFVFQQHGFVRNPWDHEVQFRDELISRTFPEDSGFSATYRFSISGEPPAELRMVIERPDLYAVTCNGAAVAPVPGGWWLDKAFGVIDLAGKVREGENTVTLTAAPFTMLHELEAAYLLGDFALDASDAGFSIKPAAPLTLAPWNKQGLALYGGRVSYSATFHAAEAGSAYKLALPEWHGAVVEVRVNGERAGHIYHQPWARDISAQVQPGENTVEVIVTGTLKNTLGPHHNDPPRGIASPHGFRKAPETGPPPGAAYDTIGYGLFAPFEVFAME